MTTQTRKIRSATLAPALLVAASLLLDSDQTLGESPSPMSKDAPAKETKPVPERTTPPARDPKLAVQEEYQSARQQGTVEALELFIARHADDPLAEKARAELQRLSR